MGNLDVLNDQGEGNTMQFADLLRWWQGKSNRLPLPGRLTDYVALVGRYNRCLTSRGTQFIGSGTFTVGADTNRVGLWIDTTFINTAGGGQVRVFWPTFANPIVFQHTITDKQPDVAGVTPSPFSYWPFMATVEKFGPALLGGFQIQSTNPSAQTSVLEVLCNPELDFGDIPDGRISDGR